MRLNSENDFIGLVISNKSMENLIPSFPFSWLYTFNEKTGDVLDVNRKNAQRKLYVNSSVPELLAQEMHHAEAVNVITQEIRLLRRALKGK